MSACCESLLLQVCIVLQGAVLGLVHAVTYFVYILLRHCHEAATVTL